MDFLCDVDEVLTRFVERVLPYIRQVHPSWTLNDRDPESWDIFETLNHHQRKMIDAIMSQPGFCFGFRPAPGTWEAIQSLRGLGCTIYAVTAPNYFPHWASERTRWLEHHFVIERHQVILTEAKHKVTGSFLLDDRPDHVVRWAAAHPKGIAMLWTTEHNVRMTQGAQYRVQGWEDVLRVVREASSHTVHMGTNDGTVPMCTTYGNGVLPGEADSTVESPLKKPRNWHWCPQCTEVYLRVHKHPPPVGSADPVYRVNTRRAQPKRGTP